MTHNRLAATIPFRTALLIAGGLSVFFGTAGTAAAQFCSEKTTAITAVGTVNIGGQVFQQGIAGTEKVNSDCTISENGDHVDGLATNPGAVLSCVLRRTSHNVASSRPPDAPAQPVLTAKR
jgi:hypothetical protein